VQECPRGSSASLAIRQALQCLVWPGEKRRGREDDSGAAEKRQQRGTVRASHLLVKHRDSRRPSSWKEANITRTQVQEPERSFTLLLNQFCCQRASQPRLVIHICTSGAMWPVHELCGATGVFTRLLCCTCKLNLSGRQ
jgi:hypothetical protein